MPRLQANQMDLHLGGLVCLGVLPPLWSSKGQTASNHHRDLNDVTVVVVKQHHQATMGNFWFSHPPLPVVFSSSSDLVGTGKDHLSLSPLPLA